MMKKKHRLLASFLCEVPEVMVEGGQDALVPLLQLNAVRGEVLYQSGVARGSRRRRWGQAGAPPELLRHEGYLQLPESGRHATPRGGRGGHAAVGREQLRGRGAGEEEEERGQQDVDDEAELLREHVCGEARLMSAARFCAVAGSCT